jgi:hypothetical protein
MTTTGATLATASKIYGRSWIVNKRNIVVNSANETATSTGRVPRRGVPRGKAHGRTPGSLLLPLAAAIQGRTRAGGISAKRAHIKDLPLLILLGMTPAQGTPLLQTLMRPT